MMGFDPVSYAMGAKSGGGGGSSGGGVLVVHADEQTMTLDKTWQEILNAEFSALSVPYSPDGGISVFVIVRANIAADEDYRVQFMAGNNALEFSATSADGYPVFIG